MLFFKEKKSYLTIYTVYINICQKKIFLLQVFECSTQMISESIFMIFCQVYRSYNTHGDKCYILQLFKKKRRTLPHIESMTPIRVSVSAMISRPSKRNVLMAFEKKCC